MELVIKIPEEVKQAFDCAESNYLKDSYYDHGGVIGNAIKNGIILPEYHGRLIDAEVACPNHTECVMCPVAIECPICAAPTIIPATGNEFFNFDAPIIKKQTSTKEKSCENCTNLNKYTGCLKHIECQRGHLKYFEPKQTATEEGDGE